MVDGGGVRVPVPVGGGEDLLQPPNVVILGLRPCYSGIHLDEDRMQARPFFLDTF